MIYFWSYWKKLANRTIHGNKRRNIQMEKLKKYGFSDYAIENLMKGKIVTTAYGKVKYDSKSGTLTTYYPDGRIKEEVLKGGK